MAAVGKNRPVIEAGISKVALVVFTGRDEACHTSIPPPIATVPAERDGSYARVAEIGLGIAEGDVEWSKSSAQWTCKVWNC